MPSIKEIEVVLRNPENKQDTLSYFIDIEATNFNLRWLGALKKNLKSQLHLEKNYCWLGWAESPRDIKYLCKQINESIAAINFFNKKNIWSAAGLKSYDIKEYFSPETVWYSPADYPVGNRDEDPKNIGMVLKNEIMNKLHRYFEDLQGQVNELSSYYKLADYETKYAIRQLNILCHELESWAVSYRKSIVVPDWQRPSQIVTFLNAPRYNLDEEDYRLFFQNKYDREMGGVYLHWAQIGKTHYEVFRDESSKPITTSICSVINGLKFYSGEFDVEWGKTIKEEDNEWHAEDQKSFRKWLTNNNFNINDPKLSLGYIKLGQVNLQKSFGTEDFAEISKKLSTHLDMYQIHADGITGTFDYVWSDDNYKQMQIDLLKPGYDWSAKNA